MLYCLFKTLSCLVLHFPVKDLLMDFDISTQMGEMCCGGAKKWDAMVFHANPYY